MANRAYLSYMDIYTPYIDKCKDIIYRYLHIYVYTYISIYTYIIGKFSQVRNM